MTSEQTYKRFISKMKKYSVDCRGNLPFAQLTTFGIGGTIKITVYPDTRRKLVKTLLLLDKLNIPYFVLGKGSNVLASDDNYDGVVVSTLNVKGVQIRKNRVKAECGESTVTLACKLRDAELSGGEFFACLPASVGGAAACNAGCFGQDVASVLKSVLIYRNGKVKRINASECRFRKRQSIFKNSRDAILPCKFKLDYSPRECIEETIRAMRKQKAETQPLNKRSAGCALYHEKAAVSRLTDKAGLKGFTVGGAEVSVKHAGFVVNNGNATAQDVLAVIDKIRREVYSRYGVCPKCEITLFNFKEEQ